MYKSYRTQIIQSSPIYMDLQFLHFTLGSLQGADRKSCVFLSYQIPSVSCVSVFPSTFSMSLPISLVDILVIVFRLVDTISLYALSI